MQPTITCKNCGSQFQGNFCSECGEKVYSAKDKSMGHIFSEIFHFITHLEGSFFTTIKTFFTRPGKMSAEYAYGIRKKYFKPVSFFLILVIAYLLFPKFQGLNMKFYTYVSDGYSFSWYAAPVALQKMKHKAFTAETMQKKYDATSAGFAKVCLLLLIPLSAFALVPLFYTSKKYFFDHFILATEISSFYIFSHYLLLPFLAFATEKLAPQYRYAFEDGSWTWKLIYFLFGAFISIAFRNFYKQARWVSTLKALVFLFVFAAGIRYVYNAILYLLVMLFI